MLQSTVLRYEGYVLGIPNQSANGDQTACKVSAGGVSVEYVSESLRTDATTTAESKPATAATGKRKWHEKFRNARKR